VLLAQDAATIVSGCFDGNLYPRQDCFQGLFRIGDPATVIESPTVAQHAGAVDDDRRGRHFGPEEIGCIAAWIEIDGQRQAGFLGRGTNHGGRFAGIGIESQDQSAPLEISSQFLEVRFDAPTARARRTQKDKTTTPFFDRSRSFCNSLNFIHVPSRSFSTKSGTLAPTAIEGDEAVLRPCEAPAGAEPVPW